MNISYENLDDSLSKRLLKISFKLEKILEFIGKIGAWLSLPLIAIIIFPISLIFFGINNLATILIFLFVYSTLLIFISYNKLK